MPSQLPRLVTRVSPIINKKITKLANIESRTVSKQLEYIIKKYIEEYENKNGIIQIDTKEDVETDKKNSNNNTAINIGIINKNKQTFN